jgi:hypothetical protein
MTWATGFTPVPRRYMFLLAENGPERLPSNPRVAHPVAQPVPWCSGLVHVRFGPGCRTFPAD